MRSLSEIISIAAERKGGADALARLLSHSRPAAELARIADERWLAEMTKCIFQAGFDWSLIEKKWPAFERAFEGFDMGRWVMMSEDDVDMLARQPDVVANIAKIRSVGANARFLTQLSGEAGSVGAYFAAARPENFFALLDRMKTGGSRLGGKTGQLFLRRMGVDALVLTNGVIAALVREGIVDKAPSSKSAIAALQSATDQWRAESGLGLTEISQILAYSIDA